MSVPFVSIWKVNSKPCTGKQRCMIGCILFLQIFFTGFDRAHATMVGSISGVGGVFLIIAIILTAIIIKKGYVKKFKRRNKVDDIYGREQESRTNNYVEEDDFATNIEDLTARADKFTTRDEGFVVRDDIFVNGEEKLTESGC